MSRSRIHCISRMCAASISMRRVLVPMRRQQRAIERKEGREKKKEDGEGREKVKRESWRQK